MPSIERLLTVLTQSGVLFVGDCKLSALTSRAYLHGRGHHYLAPLAVTGDTASQRRDGAQAALTGEQTLTPIPLVDDQGRPLPRLCHEPSLHGAAVRLLTLIEFVVRRALQREQATLVGLPPENPKKATAAPTTERLCCPPTSIARWQRIQHSQRALREW